MADKKRTFLQNAFIVVFYAAVVMLGALTFYITLGPSTERLIASMGGSERFAGLSRDITGMVVGFSVGEFAKRKLIRRLDA